MLPKCGFIFIVTFIYLRLTVNAGLTYPDISIPRVINAPRAAEQDWWKNGVFYQIYPRSFKDTNADGIGDLNGITEKMQHFMDAGITGIWLSPIYPSGGVDQGYDVKDFTNIDAEYGTLKEFKKMVDEAKKYNLKVIMDFVPNHSSDKHDWFIVSEDRSHPEHEKYKDYYIWKKNSTLDGGPPNNWISVFHGPAWTYSHLRGEFYLHQFSAEQPDLNFRLPDVKKEMAEVLNFWLDKGVYGFRLDAVPFIFEDEQLRNEPLLDIPNLNPMEHESYNHTYTMDQAETFDLIYEWRAIIDEYNKKHQDEDPRILMSEAYTSIANTMKYYGTTDKPGSHIPFNFLLVPLDKNSGAIKIVEEINKWLVNMPTGETANWVIGNHDNPRVATRFGPKLADSMNILIASLPGVMITYQGEEIGLENGQVKLEECKDPRGCKSNPEDFNKNTRDFERTPFHWDNSEPYAGFSTTEPWLPVSEKYKSNNLKTQKSADISHFKTYQYIVNLRKEPAFKNNKVDVKALSDSVIKITRTPADVTDDVYVILINLGTEIEQVLASSDTNIVYKVDFSTNTKNKKKYLRPNDITLIAGETIICTQHKLNKAITYDWWKHAVIYQIYPRSFQDSNGDGIGDLRGIITKLDHIKNLGVDAIWLSPIYQSPQVDQGYDISNFTDIDPDYGTLETFKSLVKEAKARNLRVIMDYVPNHSSDIHPWFIESRKAKAGEKYYDYYIWEDGKGDKPPNNWLSLFKNSAWEYDDERKQFYLHQFDKRQPDLNFGSEDVQKEMKEILKFWLDLGVSGFRMDAVPYLVEDLYKVDGALKDEPLSNKPSIKSNDWKYLKHIYTSDLQGTFDIIFDWRDYLDDYTIENQGDERIMMTEGYTDIYTTMFYYGNNGRKGAQFAFNFQLVEGVDGTSDAIDFTAVIKQWIDLIPDGYTSNWVLGNHDRHRLATRFGPKNLDGLNMLGSVLPGVMVTYNGEEIGQENGEVTFEEGQDPIACSSPKEDFNKLSRDFQRTPFHWDTTDYGGFSRPLGNNKPWLPVSKKYIETNLQLQVDKNNSHYNIYRRLIQLRKEPAFVIGKFKVKAATDYVLTSARINTVNDTYFHLFNLGTKAETFNLTTSYEETTPFLKVVITSDADQLPEGKLLNANNMTLLAHQSVIAITTSEMESSARIPLLSTFIFLFTLLLYTINDEL